MAYCPQCKGEHRPPTKKETFYLIISILGTLGVFIVLAYLAHNIK